MMDERDLAHARRESLPIAKDAAGGPRRLVEMFLSRRSAATRRSYQSDWRDFAVWLEAPSIPAALAMLLDEGPGPANETAMRYKGALLARGLSSGTVNRRLSALRSAVKMARTVGLCAFGLDVQSERAAPVRDTRGPTLDLIREALEHLDRRNDRLGARNASILWLLFGLGLRRAEVCSLDREHYDRGGARLSILGKGETARQWLTLDKCPRVVAALEGWLSYRGDGRLSTVGVYEMLRTFDLRPHAIRHSAITAVARRSGGDVFGTMAFSRHKNPATVARYVDNLTDRAGDMAGLLDSAL